jgi:UDP-glucose 4-epimerase
MKIVIVGATGNVGTSVIRSMASDPEIESIVGIARRRPDIEAKKTTWVQADITTDDLAPHFEGASAVIHLAWLIQPSRDLAALTRTNVEGSARVFRAVAEAGVKSLVYASSVGAYSPGPKDRTVDESWPTNGIETSFYSRHKAQTERMLDRFETERTDVRVVRLRPALIFKREAATGVRRLFFGPLLPNGLVRRSLIPMVPNIDRLRFQTVHSYDIGEAYRLAAVSDVRGAFNIAADPILDPQELGRILDARPLGFPPAVLRAGAAITWRLRLQPTPKGWVDMALQAPLLDSSRALKELGWSPTYSSEYALKDLLEGLRDGADFPTPPLAASSGGKLRGREFGTGIGQRSF